MLISLVEKNLRTCKIAFRAIIKYKLSLSENKTRSSIFAFTKNIKPPFPSPAQ